MTAPAKMTAERAKYIVEHPEEFGDIGPLGWSQVHHAKGFLEGLQAGRAEMAEELITSKMLGTVGEYYKEEIRQIAQRDGGKNV